MTRSWLATLPAALGALVLAACSALLAANMLVEVAGHTHMRLVPGLTGTVLPLKPRWTRQGLLDGSAQAAFAQVIGTRMPLYPWAVRLRNEVEYQLFDTTPLPSLIIGPHGTIVEDYYTTDWCSRDIAAWRPGAVTWASHIREMQDTVERRGHSFLYVLTPSKVAQYPADLPAGYNCPARPADQTGWLPAWRAILQQAGVHLADAAAAVSAAHADYPFPLFPPGGTHWNAVGAAIAQNAILAALGQALPGHGIAPEPFSWAMQPHATGNDLDLARLLNLFQPAFNGPVPAVTVQHAPPPAICHPPQVVIIGGSFSHQTLERLSELACPVPVAEYEYWAAYTLGWDGSAMSLHHGVDPAARDAAILAADMLIYEENEQTMRHPRHGEALYALLHALPP